jgi:hypothetical protein
MFLDSRREEKRFNLSIKLWEFASLTEELPILKGVRAGLIYFIHCLFNDAMMALCGIMLNEWSIGKGV